MTEGREQGWFTVRWSTEGVLLLDQRRLPGEETYLTLTTVEEVAQAIESLAVRGAPAIGCTAAMGVARCVVSSSARGLSDLKGDLQAAVERLARTRPTAVNLFWALRRMSDVAEAEFARPGSSVPSVRDRLVSEAFTVLQDSVDNVLPVLENDVDIDGDALTITFAAPPFANTCSGFSRLYA